MDIIDIAASSLILLIFLAPFFWPVFIGILWLGWVMEAKKKNPAASSYRKLTLLSVGIGYPLLIFFLSTLLVPASKADCRFGWLDCFVNGKLALTPLVFWACAAFYMAQFGTNNATSKKWVVLGLFTGAVVSGVCFILEWLRGFNLMLLVPLYVCIWYAKLGILFCRTVDFKPADYLKTILLAAPFWLVSGWWSYLKYLSLPEKSSGCFVVTAATRGHEAIVGPFTRIERRGETRVVNRQLLTFWQFEAIWRRSFPVHIAVFGASTISSAHTSLAASAPRWWRMEFICC